ncbi:MAG: hypothetical protein LAT58_14050 [Opitutales bacterium]|nr:hypothetical protein [Opitutales bacterium]
MKITPCFRLTSLALIGSSLFASALSADWTIRNGFNFDVENEILRITTVPDDRVDNVNDGTLLRDGQPVPHQVRRYWDENQLWSVASAPAETSLQYTFQGGSNNAELPEGLSASAIFEEEGYLHLSNAYFTVRLPSSASGSTPPAPILGLLPHPGLTPEQRAGLTPDALKNSSGLQALRGDANNWIGRGEWQTKLPLAELEVETTSEGPLFQEVLLTYLFEGDIGTDYQPFAQIRIRIFSGGEQLEIEERFHMNRNDAWTFDLAPGWSPDESLVQVHGGGAGKPARSNMQEMTFTLPGERWPHEDETWKKGDRLISLLPRWTQAYDDGWFYGASDGDKVFGSLVAKAGKWVWPHETKINVHLNERGDQALLHLPTHRGSRFHYLLYMAKSDVEAAEREDNRGRMRTNNQMDGIVQDLAMRNLDRFNNKFITEWPGNNDGRFSSFFFYSQNINPTGFWRQQARQDIDRVGNQGNLGTLTWVQNMFHADAFGSYLNMWSPLNPNFNTDFIQRPIMQATRLKDHPDFETFRKRAEIELRKDIFYAITLPGGAGQECFGYLNHALGIYEKLAEVTREHLDFDPTEWPRYQAARDFLYRTSYPKNGRRHIHPGGDTHPRGERGTPTVGDYGLSGDARELESEEFPGFGVVLRNHSGTDRETYFALKSGPNRGHFHGDQLSFHYAAHANPLAVDHHVSFNPRAGQEHMHNRVSFGTEEMPWANMDGYERTIAFETGEKVDIVMGQVESNRLRETTKLPPERWNQEYPQIRFDDNPLTYRRTVVQVKNAPSGNDYFVIWDQFHGPKLKATYNLHVLGEKLERDGQTLNFRELTTFVAYPENFAFDTLPWSHERAGGQTTQGARLTVEGDQGEFITVLYPDKNPPAMQAIANGVKVGDDQILFNRNPSNASDAVVIVQRGQETIGRLANGDIDLNRSQGEIGLFIPDAGYPFGEIPDWLAEQRTGIPEYAREIATPAALRWGQGAIR